MRIESFSLRCFPSYARVREAVSAGAEYCKYYMNTWIIFINLANKTKWSCTSSLPRYTIPSLWNSIHHPTFLYICAAFMKINQIKRWRWCDICFDKQYTLHISYSKDICNFCTTTTSQTLHFTQIPSSPIMWMFSIIF